MDNESKTFAKSIGLEERMECYSDQSAFIMLKGLKENIKQSTKDRSTL